jgi:hypothetical protein
MDLYLIEPDSMLDCRSFGRAAQVFGYVPLLCCGINVGLEIFVNF